MRLPIFTPCPHRTGPPTAGGVCSACWEERASQLNVELTDLKEEIERVSVCGKHLKELKKGGCIVCRSETDKEALTYLTKVVHAAANALDAQTSGDPKADKLLEVALEGILKAGEFLEDRATKTRLKRFA